MEFRDVVRRRRMVRNYTGEPVEPAAVRRILATAVHAPSAGFSQGWAFLLLDTPGQVTAFWSAATPPGRGDDRWSAGLRRAPVLVLACSAKRIYLDRYAEPDKGWTDRSEAHWPIPWWHVDTGMAALLMCCAAVDEGLAACLFGLPAESIDPVRAAFEIPADHEPVAVVAVGHGAPDHRSPSLARGRRPLTEVVHAGSWSRPFAG